MSKKILISLITFVITLSLVACGSDVAQQSENNSNNKESNEVKKEEEPTQEEITQEELNAKIKEEATEADWVKLNGSDDEFEGQCFYAQGKVNVLVDDAVFPSFTLTVETENGFGIYNIIVIEKENFNALTEGDEVRVYGKLMGKSSLGFPELSGNIIEKIN